LLPLGAQKPFGAVNTSMGLFGHPAQVFRLNSRLAAWAQSMAQAVQLCDSAELAKARQQLC
jgi:purine nucleoside permease